MHFEIKYVITDNEEIIVFSELLSHDTFKRLNPISAGFITFNTNSDGHISCKCYGESISLDLKSRPAEDTEIAMLQLNMLHN